MVKDYVSTLKSMDALALDMMRFQVMDSSRPDFGGWFSDEYGFASPCHIGNSRYISILGGCFFSEGSALYGDKMVWERLLNAVRFQKKAVRESGLLDLPFTNFDSPPDTCFALSLLASVAYIAKVSTLAEAKIFLAELEPYVIKCVSAVLKDGFHTPNHRWVITSALLQAQDVFPTPDVTEKVNDYIAEGIDINSDGFYSEKSAGCYNAIVNRSLIYIYELTGKEEFKNAVLKNLDNILYLVHADGSVVTSVSIRQDNGLTKYLDECLDGFYYAAHLTGDGRHSAVAEELLKKGDVSEHLLYLFAKHPEWKEKELPPATPMGDYKVFMKESGVWRVKRGKLSLTAAVGMSGALSVKYGSVNLSQFRIFSPYFAGAKFKSSKLEEIENGIRIYYESEFLLPQLPSYWMPTKKPFPFEELPYKTLEKRELKPRPQLYYTMDIIDLGDSFTLSIKSSQGMNSVPFIAELLFTPNGRIESDCISVPMHADDTVLLKSGDFHFVNNADCITVSGTGHAHRANYSGVEGTNGMLRAVISDWTPVDRTITLRFGQWSEAEGICYSANGPVLMQ